MIWILALTGCKQEAEPDLREAFDNPTAELSASVIPQVLDDYVRNVRSYRWERTATALLGLTGGSGARTRSPLPSLQGDEVPAEPFIGGLVCAVNFITDLATYESCGRGDDCEVELTFRSCLMSDEYRRGRFHLRVREEQRSEFDRGVLEIDFDRFRTDHTTPGFASEIDGILSIEGTTFRDRDREELLYLADFRTRLLDMEGRGLFGGGVLEDLRVRAGMRIAIEQSPDLQDVEVEMVAFVDDDGDGLPTASVILRMGIEQLEEDDLSRLTMEIEGASGVWTCNWTNVLENGDDIQAWQSIGSCFDQAGNEVGFDGTVGE